MLKALADFPHAGSAAFLRVEPEEPPKLGMAWPVEAVRIIRYNPDGNAFVAITGRRAMAEIASGNLTVPRKRLFATIEQAMFPGRRAKRSKAA